MFGDRRFGAAGVTRIVLTVSLLALAAGCTSSPCREGDNSRFRCDPSAASRMPQQTVVLPD